MKDICNMEEFPASVPAAFATLDDLCLSVIVSFLNPMEAICTQTINKHFMEMVNRSWKDKRYIKPIQHLTKVKRRDLCDKDITVVAWKAVQQRGFLKSRIYCLGGTRVGVHNDATISFCDDSTAISSISCPEEENGFPTELSAPAATVDAFGRICSLGGFSGENSVSDCFVYSPCTNNDTRIKDNIESCSESASASAFRWSLCGSLPLPCCFASACTTINGTIFFTGGGSTLLQGATVSSETYLQTDPNVIEWTKVSSMYHRRCGHSSALLPSGNIIVTGGYAGGMDYLTASETFDVSVNKWMPNKSMNFPRSGFGFGLSQHGAVYAFGGSPDGSNGHNSVEMFDERVGQWLLLESSMCAKRGYMGGCYGGGSGNFYAAGGVHNFDPSPTIEFMDPRTNRWQFLSFDNSIGASPDSHDDFYFYRCNFTMLHSI